MNKELLKGSTVTLILSLINSRAMYGYEIIKEMEKKSQGLFNFKEGTLYPILHNLELEGIIDGYWYEGEGTRKRKYYKLAKKGEEFLKEKKQEWTQFKGAVDKVLWEVVVCS